MAISRVKWTGSTVTWPEDENGGSSWAFWWSGKAGGYIHCDYGNRRRQGILGNQICQRGAITGSTLTADSYDDFIIKIKKWVRQYRTRYESKD